jgi:hypothetical protein
VTKIRLTRPIGRAGSPTSSKGPADQRQKLRAARRDRERKTERLDIRVTPSVKGFVERIMDVTGLTAGDLLLLGGSAILRDLETEIEVKRPGYGTYKIRRPD